MLPWQRRRGTEVVVQEISMNISLQLPMNLQLLQIKNTKKKKDE